MLDDVCCVVLDNTSEVESAVNRVKHSIVLTHGEYSSIGLLLYRARPKKWWWWGSSAYRLMLAAGCWLEAETHGQTREIEQVRLRVMESNEWKSRKRRKKV